MYHHHKDGTECWTLLCICSNKVSFAKADLVWYATRKVALERGYAVAWECVGGTHLGAEGKLLDQLAGIKLIC